MRPRNPGQLGGSKRGDASCLLMFFSSIKNLIEASRLGILLDLPIPLVRDILLKPLRESGEFICREFSHGILDFLDAHEVTLRREVDEIKGKAREINEGALARASVGLLRLLNVTLLPQSGAALNDLSSITSPRHFPVAWFPCSLNCRIQRSFHSNKGRSQIGWRARRPREGDFLVLLPRRLPTAYPCGAVLRGGYSVPPGTWRSYRWPTPLSAKTPSPSYQSSRGSSSHRRNADP